MFSQISRRQGPKSALTWLEDLGRGGGAERNEMEPVMESLVYFKMMNWYIKGRSMLWVYACYSIIISWPELSQGIMAMSFSIVVSRNDALN